MSKNKFEIASFKYENLSNRMERLRHSQNHSSTTNLRAGSVDRNNDNKPLTRTNSTALLATQNLNQTSLLNYLQQDSCLDIGSRYSGRVAKNTGIRKYNQRMLKEVGNTNKATPPKYSATQVKTRVSPLRKQTLPASSLLENSQNRPSPVKRNLFDRKIQASQFADGSGKFNPQTYGRRRYEAGTLEGQTKTQEVRLKLEPGKIYTRQELQKYFGA